jgi:SAM-dependent methyltransferase
MDDVVFRHAQTPGWWDGCARYYNINRNIIAMCQANTMKELLLALFSKGIGFDMGGPGFKFPDGRKVRGLDFMLNSAHDIQADMLNLPFKDNSVDYITSFHALEHLTDIEKGISEFVRVIKHNGIIFSVMPDRRYFAHDNANPNLLKGMAAPSEMVPDEMLKILKKFSNIEILLFDSHQNNFDFDFLLRKI